VQCLEQIERIYTEDEGVKNLIKRSFGGLEKLKKNILYDFFKTAFDGSGMVWREGGREGGRESGLFGIGCWLLQILATLFSPLLPLPPFLPRFLPSLPQAATTSSAPAPALTGG